MDKQKEKTIESVIMQIDKQYGKGSIMKLGEESSKQQIPSISTGSFGLDIALGIGGVPRGRIIEIYGPASSGKTTLTLHIIAEAQRSGGTAVFIDAEHTLDPVYAARLGVNTDDLLVSQPNTGEQAFEITEMLVRSGVIDVIVIDSVAALIPKEEIDGDLSNLHIGLQARLISQAMRKLAGITSKSNTCVILINQIRYMFRSIETTTGGNALKFYSSVRLDIRIVETLKLGEEVQGNRVKVKVVKNKVAPPFRQAEFDILYNSGISREGEIFDLGVKFNIISKAGTWYAYNKEHMGQGRENVKKYLIENTRILKEIENRIKIACGIVKKSR